MSKFVEVVMSLALFFMVGVGMTLVVTMHQLAVTLQTITLSIEPESAENKNKVMKMIATCWWLIFGACELYANDKPIETMYLIICAQMLLMILVYISVIIMLNRNLQNLKGNFKSEIVSINF